MNQAWKIIGLIAVLVILWFTWTYLSTIVLYILVAAFLSMMGQPLMIMLRKIRIKQFKIPKALCAVITISAFYALFALFIAQFVPLIIEQINTLASIDLENGLKSIEGWLNDLNEFLTKYQLAGESDPVEQIKEAIRNFFSSGNVLSAFGTLFGFLGNLVGVLTALFSITFIWFFFLLDNGLFYEYTSMFIPKEYESGFENVALTSKSLLTRYIFGVIIQILFATFFVWIGMYIVGVKYALLIGFFAGVANIVPYVGPIIGLSFAVLVAISSNLGMPFFYDTLYIIAKVAIIFGVMQMVDNILIQPTIFSNSVKAHPLEIFIVILIAGTLFGIGGMIMAIPIYTIVRVVAKEFLSEFKLVQTLTKEMT